MAVDSPLNVEGLPANMIPQDFDKINNAVWNQA